MCPGKRSEVKVRGKQEVSSKGQSLEVRGQIRGQIRGQQEFRMEDGDEVINCNEFMCPGKRSRSEVRGQRSEVRGQGSRVIGQISVQGRAAEGCSGHLM